MVRYIDKIHGIRPVACLKLRDRRLLLLLLWRRYGSRCKGRYGSGGLRVGWGL